MTKGNSNGMDMVYVIGDGDNIRQRMERQLLYENVDGCKDVSEAITAGMKYVDNLVSSRRGWEVVFCGGDDILIKVHARYYDPEFIRLIIREFERCSESTMCFGSAKTLQNAYVNLRRAKIFGAGTLICEAEKNSIKLVKFVEVNQVTEA